MARKEPKYTNLPAKELPPYQLYKRWQKATGYSSMDRFGSLPREEALKAIGEASGKGWHGDTPGHRKAALKAEGKGAINEPIRTTQPHRKLTEKERDRMIDLHASAPLTYRPSIDDELIKIGLVQMWDNTKDAVENTNTPFYDKSGRILPEWYDFKHEHEELPQEMQEKHTYLQGYTINGMKFTLIGVEYTETKANKKAIQYAKDNRVAEVKKEGDEYLIYVSEQYTSTKAHRKLTEKGQAPKYTPPYRVDVWEERDRLIITVYDSKDKEVASWVDEEAREMFENGFFESKDVEESVLGYLTDRGTIRR